MWRFRQIAISVNVQIANQDNLISNYKNILMNIRTYLEDILMEKQSDGQSRVHPSR
jgi:hypothetical protein